MQIDVAQLETHRVPLTGHCYRMMGSIIDADDAVQLTMERAWKNLARFDGRSSLRTWLYRIATNVCLDLLGERSRRERPIERGGPGNVGDPLPSLPREHWVEPALDSLVIPTDADPSEQLVLRQSIRLAFVTALQHLPARQRAVLLLAEVLGWSANDIADNLETTVASVNSALQRARATLGELNVDARPTTLTDEQAQTVERYVDAFLRYDVESLVSLLRDDATLSMPPIDFWLQGPESIRAWLNGPGCGCKGSKLLPMSVNGLPAFAQWRYDETRGFFPWAVLVLELDGDRISGWNAYLDVAKLFPRFGVALTP
ncbi:MAG: sigma-70 family RNA polymerase sigma factor [Archangium sp.]